MMTAENIDCELEVSQAPTDALKEGLLIIARELKRRGLDVTIEGED
jgi:hypothetical protein